MTVERLDRAGLDRVRDEWDALGSASGTPFTGATWTACWWDAFAPGADALVLAARDGGELVGALPVVRHGRRLSAMANDHSPLFSPPARDERARGALVDAALELAPAGLHLPNVPDGDPLTAGRVGAWRATRPGNVALVVETAGAFADWREQTKRRWGAPLERFRRKMGREHHMRLLLNEPPADLERELERGFAVEGSGWKGRARTAIVSAPETESFYRAVASAFLTRGELACSSLELDGRMVAWDLSLRHGNRIWLLKTGYDEEFRRFAPGLVLRLSVIEDCFARGLAAHELLGTVDDWKPKFATTERAHTSIDLFPRTATGAAGWAARRARHVAARALHAARERS